MSMKKNELKAFIRILQDDLEACHARYAELISFSNTQDDENCAEYVKRIAELEVQLAESQAEVRELKNRYEPNPWQDALKQADSRPPELNPTLERLLQEAKRLRW